MKAEEIAEMVEMLPEQEQDLAYDERDGKALGFSRGMRVNHEEVWGTKVPTKVA